MSLADDLRAAKALIDSPERFAGAGNKSGLSLHQVVDNLSNEDDDRYNAMWRALNRARPDASSGLIRWSHREASHADIMALFDRAISAAEAKP